jgi:heterotetrameric sarcosine oxidase gamma subunit
VAEPVPASPLARVLQPGDHGRVGPDGPGVSFRERRDLAVVSIMAGPKARAEVDAALQPLGLALPGVGGTHQADEGPVALWAALDRWHVLAHEDGPALLARLHAALGDRAALVDQTAGTCLIEIAGPRLDAVLEKATPVDLHGFAPGETRATSINHLSVHLWKRSADTVLVAVPRSFGRDLLEFLHEMALEVGYRDRR